MNTAARALGRQFGRKPEPCVHCGEPSHELNWQDQCPECVENRRADGMP